MKQALAGLALVLCHVLAQAQPALIRLMVGFPAGGGTDAIARVLSEQLGAALSTSVIVENKAGAGGQIAAQALKVAPKDGSVLFLSHDHTISILPLVLKNPGFHPQQDFTPVAIKLRKRSKTEGWVNDRQRFSPTGCHRRKTSDPLVLQNDSVRASESVHR